MIIFRLILLKILFRTIQRAFKINVFYKSERNSLAKLAPHLTVKSCYPSSIERQNEKLVLKVVNELTQAALEIQNELRCHKFRNSTSDLVRVLIYLWKLFNINTPFKGIRLNDSFSSPLTLNDERFSFLTRIVFWLDAWHSLPGKLGKLSKQTYKSFRHACIALPRITNHLIQHCVFSFLFSSFLQTDPLKHHFGLYRLMSGSNYYISYLQVLETERRLKLSSILKMFPNQYSTSFESLQNFIKSFSSPSLTGDEDGNTILDPFFEGIVLFAKYCPICEISKWNILEKIIFTAANCFLANKIKNYNSLVISKGVEKRKLKKFS